MKTLINISFVASLALSLGACGNGLVDEVSSWKDKACACEDKACAEKQGKAYVALGKKFKDEKPSKEDAKKLDNLADSGQECLEKHGVDVYSL